MCFSDAQQLAAFFRALASPTRIKLIRLLRDHPLCVGAIATRLGLSQGAVSQHLAVLRQAGLVRSEKRGMFVHYSLCTDLPQRIAEGLEAALGLSAGEDEVGAKRPPAPGGARRSV
ncbi:MAG: winged helix-turn-helix transcriptional regulator [Armatimonadetes bacterium]|nr:winged helix-turn-helix transcriptional regulator [Armatimonadota bacterium]